MEKGQILTYSDVAVYAAGSSNEQLVDVRSYSGLIEAEYIKMDMIPTSGKLIFVRETIARKLASVAKALNRRGYALKVVYGYRSPSVQAKYFQARKEALALEYPELSNKELDSLTHNFVAVPGVAGHPTGGAIDLTLTQGGIEVDMGSVIADFSDVEKIKTYASGLTDAQSCNRQILLDAMLAEEFAPFYGEWWHFSYGDREWAACYDNKSIYGQLDFSETLVTAAGGNGTAIQTIDSPLRREDYEERGKLLGERYEEFGA